MKAYLTPAQAALRASVSRPTIMTAIKKGKLPAKRDNKSWAIHPDDLDKWSEGRGERVSPSVMQDDSGEISALRVENAVLKAKLDAKDEVIAVLRDQLDHARLPFWKRWR